MGLSIIGRMDCVGVWVLGMIYFFGELVWCLYCCCVCFLFVLDLVCLNLLFDFCIVFVVCIWVVLDCLILFDFFFTFVGWCELNC